MKNELATKECAQTVEQIHGTGENLNGTYSTGELERLVREAQARVNDAKNHEDLMLKIRKKHTRKVVLSKLIPEDTEQPGIPTTSYRKAAKAPVGNLSFLLNSVYTCGDPVRYILADITKELLSETKGARPSKLGVSMVSTTSLEGTVTLPRFVARWSVPGVFSMKTLAGIWKMCHDVWGDNVASIDDNNKWPNVVTYPNDTGFRKISRIDSLK